MGDGREQGPHVIRRGTSVPLSPLMQTKIAEARSSYKFDGTEYTYYGASDKIVLSCFYGPHDDEMDMAFMRFNLAQWEIIYYETIDPNEDAKFAYFSDYDEAMEFLTVQQVLVRML